MSVMLPHLHKTKTLKQQAYKKPIRTPENHSCFLASCLRFFLFFLLFAVLKFEQSEGNANICLGQLANTLPIRGRVGPHLFYWSKRVSGQPLLYSIFFCCYYGGGGDTVVKTQDIKLWLDQSLAWACREHNRHVQVNSITGISPTSHEGTPLNQNFFT